MLLGGGLAGGAAAGDIAVVNVVTLVGAGGRVVRFLCDLVGQVCTFGGLASCAATLVPRRRRCQCIPPVVFSSASW